MKPEDLSTEQLDQAQQCEAGDEYTAPVQEQDVELSDEQLAGAAGGARIRRGPIERERRD